MPTITTLDPYAEAGGDWLLPKDRGGSTLPSLGSISGTSPASPVTLSSPAGGAAKASGALSGLASGVGGLLTGGILPLAQSVLGGIFGGPDTPAGPSGGGIFTAGGVNIGSKVVGSGSAATSFPSASVPGSGIVTDNSATAGGLGIPKWVVPVVVGLVALVVGVLLFRKPRKSRE